MTATATMQENGRTRKSLAEQIDRLDSILDRLADALGTEKAENGTFKVREEKM